MHFTPENEMVHTFIKVFNCITLSTWLYVSFFHVQSIFVKYRYSLIIIINYLGKRLAICSAAYVILAIGSIIIYESLIALWPSGTTKSRQVTRRNDHAYVEANHQKLIAVILRRRCIRKRETSNSRIFNEDWHITRRCIEK